MDDNFIFIALFFFPLSKLPVPFYSLIEQTVEIAHANTYTPVLSHMHPDDFYLRMDKQRDACKLPWQHLFCGFVHGCLVSEF